jgi:hypothetical protein
MPQNLADGWSCFLGASLPGYICEDAWPSTATLLLLYVVVNFAFNMALLSMVKHGSALYLVVAVAVALPITNLVFTQRWAMGADVEALSLYNLLGIVLVVAGFLLYSLLPDGRSGQLGADGLPADGSSGALLLGSDGLPIPGSQAPHNVYDSVSREFVVPTGASGHCMYLTEYLPSVADNRPSIEESVPFERRHSFDFHSSPSVSDVKKARKNRLAKVIGNKTPSRTP